MTNRKQDNTQARKPAANDHEKSANPGSAGQKQPTQGQGDQDIPQDQPKQPGQAKPDKPRQPGDAGGDNKPSTR